MKASVEASMEETSMGTHGSFWHVEELLPWKSTNACVETSVENLMEATSTEVHESFRRLEAAVDKLSGSP